MVTTGSGQLQTTVLIALITIVPSNLDFSNSTNYFRIVKLCLCLLSFILP